MQPHTLLLLFLLLSFTPASAQDRFDVVIYGGTAGGTVAAVAAAGEGATVALLEPGGHLGGMLSGGLGRSDMDRQQHVIGGLSRRFFEAAGQHYRRDIAWTFEPKVAEAILNHWVQEAGVRVLFGKRIDRVEMASGRISRIVMLDGSEYAARVYIDASYEGDLMARAGITYTVGREGSSAYGESLAGVREIQPGNHQLLVPISPYDENGNLLPYVVDESEVGPVGSADRKVQAYCFRICLTRNEENRVPIPRPDNYDPKRYELLRRYLQRSQEVFKNPGHPLGISEIPNGKTDINSGGPISTNLLSASWEYPEAGYERRQEIWDEHLSWAQGMIYFLTHDPGVPESLRQSMSQWGLPKDEFVDTGHWPHQMYIREARRMLGEYILTQHDLETRRSKPDSIGLGGYNMDVREVQWVAKTVFRFVVPQKEVLMEGYITVPVEPYAIPYRSLLPRLSECTNLLVTSCISASHMAYSSVRMEPQYMILGHSAGVAAALAAEAGTGVHQVDVAALQLKLRQQGQILTEEEALPRN